ncbi:MAG: FecR family protein [Verrucomicrobiota bacterium]
MKPSGNKAEQLVDAYFLGQLSESEIADLQELLKTDFRARNYFASAARDEWLLHHLHSDLDAQLVEDEGRSRIISAPMMLFVRAAAIIVVMLTVASLFIYHDGSHPSGRSLGDRSFAALVTDNESKAVATVTDIFTLVNDNITATINNESRNLNAGMPLRNGDEIELPTGARLTFQYDGEETYVKMGSGTRFTLAESNGAKYILLDTGEMSADVAPQPVGKPMTIRTKDAEAVVLGTEFEVKTGEVTRLAVLSGKVGFQSPDKVQNIEVDAGQFATSTTDQDWVARPFIEKVLTPVFDRTLNTEQHDRYIIIDPKRNFEALLRFDFGDLDGSLMEAKLQLRVEAFGQDYGGAGTVRLYMDPTNATDGDPARDSLVEIASYSGRVDAKMNLEFEIDPSDLKEGINTFIVKLDEKGNDFWFSSSRGPNPPKFILKIVNTKA